MATIRKLAQLARQSMHLQNETNSKKVCRAATCVQLQNKRISILQNKTTTAQGDGKRWNSNTLNGNSVRIEW